MVNLPRPKAKRKAPPKANRNGRKGGARKENFGFRIAREAFRMSDIGFRIEKKSELSCILSNFGMLDQLLTVAFIGDFFYIGVK